MSRRRRSSTESVNEIWYDAKQRLSSIFLSHTGQYALLGDVNRNDNNGMSQKPIRSLVRRTSSAMWEERPQTPTGWTILLAVVASTIFGYEMQLQQELTAPPFVFLQRDNNNADESSVVSVLDNAQMQAIYKILTSSPNGILAQVVKPSLWVGTRGTLSSSFSLVAGTPHHSDDHVRFREIVTMPIDGAQLALDWEAPSSIGNANNIDDRNDDPQQHVLQYGPITKPVILILHGINNDSSAAYIRALQRTLTNRGHVAIGMNFRGCGGLELKTPRGYNGSYTGDLRSTVHMLEARLSPGIPLFLVGFSLGANLVTKYLGEEGLSGTLPQCVAGGASLGNPLEIHSKDNMHTPWKQLIGLGVKIDLAKQWRALQQTWVYPELKEAYMKALKATCIHEIDEAFCPVVIRNEPYYPYATKIGFKNGEEYWHDSSSYRFIKHISVPLLQIIAGDDKVVYHSFLRKLTHSIRNPNVMCVETKCGGHLGWQESPPPSKSGDNDGFVRVGPSWASRATADFIDAILQTRPRVQSEHKDKNRAKAMWPKTHTWEQPPPDTTTNNNSNSGDDHTVDCVPVMQSRL